MSAADTFSLWKLRPARKKAHAAGRSVSLDETWAGLQTVLPQVPVSRISDLTPLDRLGLPTFSAVTPLAKDLTTHMGKGMTRQGARISAVMEAIERVSAEQAPQQHTFFADRPGPMGLELLAALATPGDDPVVNHEAIHWVSGWDLLRDEAADLPLDLVISPGSGELHDRTDTNGLASGNTLLEAVVHALCELIERDAVSQLEFRSAFVARASQDYPALVLASLPAAAIGLAQTIADQGLELVLHDIRSDIRVPTFRAMIIDRYFAGKASRQPLYSPGFGTHPDASVAACRAITEAIQARIGFIQGARDSFNATPFMSKQAHLSLQQQLKVQPTLHFDAVDSACCDELMDDLQLLLDGLRSVGIDRCLVAELTRAQWSVPVVRIRVPGLSQFLIHRDRPDQRCLRHLL